MTVEVFAPAKINLFLKVTGRRDDGYHLLQSLAVFPDIGDHLICAASDRLNLTVDGPMAGSLAGTGDNNLVLRAARALQAATGTSRGAAMTLTKMLPVASGIGGGSADAGATLRALCRLWDLQLDGERLDHLAASLGADVPVCQRSCPSLMSGIGDRLSPPPALPECVLVLVNPGVALWTPQVFAGLDRLQDAVRVPSRIDSFTDLVSWLRNSGNDLQQPAMAAAPPIAEVLAALAATGASYSAMSGSGATCFALCQTEAEAARVAAALNAPANWWVRVAKVSDDARHHEAREVVQTVPDFAGRET